MKSKIVKKIIMLVAQNELGGRSWELCLLSDGYKTIRQEWGGFGDSYKEGYIPTSKAIEFIRLAKGGNLPVDYLCWGVDDFFRGLDGNFYGYSHD